MRLFQVASAALAAFAVVRSLALFLESYSAERAEHSGDEDLARLCNEGQAPTSLRMRATCLDLVRARATPLFLKAALRAANVAYEEFASSLLTPRSVMAVCLFVLTGVATPILRLARLAFPNARAFDDALDLDEEAERGTQRIVYLGDLGQPVDRRLWGWDKVRSRLLGVDGRKALHAPAYVEDVTAGSTGWNEVQLGPARQQRQFGKKFD